MSDDGGKPLNLAYLLLGSNIDPERNLKASVGKLGIFGRILAVSSVWESWPAGDAGTAVRGNFLNAAVLLETALSPQALRDTAIASIEMALRRVRTGDKNGSRTIDVDLLLFNHETFRLGGRRIPSPDILERPFVAIPLAEIAPDYVHPETSRTLSRIARSLDPRSAGMRLRKDVVLPPVPFPSLPRLPG